MLHIEQQGEEFQEADILWPEAAQGPELQPQQVLCYSHAESDEEDHGRDEFSSDHRPVKLQIGGQRASSPIDIPRRKGGAKGTSRKAQPGFSKIAAGTSYGGGGSVAIGSHVFVPPHVIVDRRTKRDKAMMLFVVPSGKARKIREQYY